MVNMLKVLVAVIILLIIIGIAMLGKKILRTLIFKTAKTPSAESTWLEAIAGIIVVGIALANYINKRPDENITMWIGTIIFFLGGLLQLLARKQLHEDKTFEERLSSGFEAAQTGLYSKLRHPSKSALLLLMLGLCLALQSWWALGLYIILFFPSVLYRISQEEKALLDKFGERWMSYKDDTKRIIPGFL
jgi:protein-S-isoprenylcysteine O-methyltransferase Ste14